VIATLGLLFSPWLQSQEEILQVVHRIFPVFRGLYQDKVANIWCAVNVVIKLREMFDIQELVRFSTVATLVSFLPSVLYLIAKPTKRGLIYGLINSSLSFFLLSFQVHEKSILVPALPITLLILDEPAIASLFVTLATFSMFPLLRQEELTLPYYVLLAFWAWMTSGSFSSAPRFLRFVAVVSERIEGLPTHVIPLDHVLTFLLTFPTPCSCFFLFVENRSTCCSLLRYILPRLPSLLLCLVTLTCTLF
jgi:alpha-1,3-glucosyltransferase